VGAGDGTPRPGSPAGLLRRLVSSCAVESFEREVEEVVRDSYEALGAQPPED